MRKLVIALMVLIIVVGALLGLALYNIDSLLASYKDRIIAAVEQRTGRKVAYGSVHVKLRGGIGIRIRELAISEDPAFGSGHFLRATDTRINVRVHLLTRRITVTGVALDRPVIRIIRNARGVFNFTGLGFPVGAAPRPTTARGIGVLPKAAGLFAAQTPEAVREVPGSGTHLAIAHLEVSGGTLDYHDKKDRRRVQLKHLDLKGDDLRKDGPFKVKAAAAFLEGRQNVRFEGLVGPVVSGAGILAVPVDGTVDIETLSWEALRRSFPGVDAAWPDELALTGALRTEGLALKGTLKDLGFDGDLDLTRTGLRYGDDVRKPPDTALRLGADARAVPGSIAFKRFELILDGLNIKGEGDLEFGSPATLDLSLDLAASEMRGWERWVPLLADYRLSGSSAAKVDVTGKMGGGALPDIRGTVTFRDAAFKTPVFEKPLEALSAEVEFSNRGATLRGLSFRIGETRLAGKATAESFTPLTLSYRLASPSLRMADLGLQPDDAVLEGARGSGRLTWPEGLFFEGDLNSERGKVVGLDYTDLKARFRVAAEHLGLESFRLDTLGGSLDASGGMQLQGPSSEFDLAARLDGIDIRQYLAGIAGLPEVAGTLNAELSVKGKGRTWDDIKTTLTGKGKAAVVEGRVLDVNLAEQALQGLTGIRGLTSLFSGNLKDKYPQVFKKETTVFEQLDTEAGAADGRIVVERITLKAKYYGIAGKGWIGLDGATDLDGVLTLSEDLSADLLPGSRLTPVTNQRDEVEVPFNITGTMPDVRLRPRLQLIEKVLEKTVGRGVKGVLDLIPEVGGKPAGKKGEKPGEPPAEKDPVQKLIERALRLFGGER